jgi:hypothetical protein
LLLASGCFAVRRRRDHDCILEDAFRSGSHPGCKIPEHVPQASSFPFSVMLNRQFHFGKCWK